MDSYSNLGNVWLCVAFVETGTGAEAYIDIFELSFDLDFLYFDFCFFRRIRELASQVKELYKFAQYFRFFKTVFVGLHASALAHFNQSIVEKCKRNLQTTSDSKTRRQRGLSTVLSIEGIGQTVEREA